MRLLSGAVVLALLAWWRRGGNSGRGNWRSALALFAYAAAFSFAYVKLTAAAGALLLFGAVQATMIAHGLWSGERLRPLQLGGLLLACGGLVGLVLPGLSAPPLLAALLMVTAGIAWGVYSLRGRGAGDPLQVTAGNFLRAVPMAALASGVGYAIWYTALPFLKSVTAATVQLAVPVIAAMGGVLLLGEPLTPRLLAASAAILGGVALVVLLGARGRANTPASE